MKNPSVDSSRFPLMLVSFDGPTSDQDFASYLDELSLTTERALREKRRVAFVMDARRAAC